MPFQPVPNCAGVTIVQSCNAVTLVNTFYGRFQGADYGEGDVIALAAAMNDWTNLELKPFLSSNWTYLRTEARGLEEENDILAIDATNAGAGGIAQTPNPLNVALCVSRRSNLTGRSARGRVYIGGTVQGQIDTANEQFFTQAFTDAIEAALNTVVTYMSAALWDEVIVSRYSGGVLRAAGITFDVLEYVATDRKVDTMRARMT